MKPELNLDNPIFVYYLNVDGMTYEQIGEVTKKLNDVWSFDNVVTWIVPRRHGETKIECVYDGRIKNRGEELIELINDINERIDILSGSNDFEDFKIFIRDWRLSNILK